MGAFVLAHAQPLVGCRRGFLGSSCCGWGLDAVHLDVV